MTRSNLDVAIIIVNWNTKDDVLACLRQLETIGEMEKCRVIVVDNASTDGSVEAVRKEFEQVEIVECTQNFGYAQGNTWGAREALDNGAEYLFILNPDTLVHAHCIDRLRNRLEKDDHLGIVGPAIYKMDGTIWACGGWIDKKRYSAGVCIQPSQQIDYVPGTAMMIRRTTWEDIGGFTHDYFGYFEDVEFCQRVHLRGWQIASVPDARVDHRESTSFGMASPAKAYYMARNHLLFVQRNATGWIKIRELIRLPKTIWEHWVRGESSALLGIRDYFQRRFGKQTYW